jgi:hypothetical protein
MYRSSACTTAKVSCTRCLEVCKHTCTAPRVHLQLTFSTHVQAPPQKAQQVEVSAELRRTTAILEVPNERAPSGATRVYILAMSHVSAVSCDQVRELIQAVQPDAVSVELCKDRLGLLANELPPGPRVWHCPQVTVGGVPEGSGFPTKEELTALLTCKPGKPFTSDDIEADIRRLQATGLFAAVRPSAGAATAQEAPLFTVSEDADGDLALHTVPPFASLEFRCEERRLPGIESFECRVSSRAAEASVAIPQEQLDSVRDAVLAVAEGGEKKTVAALMGARARILADVGAAASVDVVFDGVASGRVEAMVVVRAADAPPVTTGLESTAEGGEGLNIETFQNPNRGDDVQVGLSSALPSRLVERMARVALGGDDIVDSAVSPSAVGADAASGVERQRGHGLSAALSCAVVRGRGRTEWRKWTWRELATAADEDPEAQPLQDLLAKTLSEQYSKLQTNASVTVGVDGGEAWRVRSRRAEQTAPMKHVLVVLMQSLAAS